MTLTMTMTGCTVCPYGIERCGSCRRRLCLEHIPLGGDACLDCEVAYQRSRDDLDMLPWFLLGFAVPWAVFAMLYESIARFGPSGGVRAITTGIPLLDAALMTSVLAFFAGKAAIAVRMAFHRRAFDRRRRGEASAAVVD